MNQVKLFMVLLLLAWAAGTSAQDVIIKKDGSTVVCHVIEVNQTEIVYKKWEDLQGNNYVISRADASAINYENGTRLEVNTPENIQTSSNIASGLGQGNMKQEMNNIKIIALNNSIRRGKSLQRFGWIGGGVLLAVGIPLIYVGISNGAFDLWSDDESAYAEYLLGTIATGSGIALGTSCVIVGRSIEGRARTELLYYSSLWQEEIPLRNGTSFMASVDMLKDRHTNTIGLGLRYSF